MSGAVKYCVNAQLWNLVELVVQLFFPVYKSERFAHYSAFGSLVDSSGHSSHGLCFYVEIDV
jgi:hypothetical protein